MANITFNIPDSKIQFFIDCYGESYDNLVEDGQIDGLLISKSQYAKSEAFDFLAGRVRKWNKQQALEAIIEIDITK